MPLVIFLKCLSPDDAASFSVNFLDSFMSLQLYSRRHVLHTSLMTAAAMGAFKLTPAAAKSVQVEQVIKGPSGTAYEVTKWSGPITGLGLLDTTGKTWQLADLRGRAVMLNFWASWCEPCRAEMPTLQQVADLYGPDKLLVLAINFKETAGRALQFAKTTGVSLPVLLDRNGQLAGQWGVKVFPTTMLLDSRGQPQQRVKGEVDWTSSAAGKLIEGLLKP